MITTTAATLGLVAGILASLGLIWHKGIKPVVHFFRKAAQRLELLDEVKGLSDRVDEIEHRTRQLTNNGGSHMKDALERIERKLDAEILGVYKHLAGTEVR